MSENPELLDLDNGGGCASDEPFALRVLGDSMEPEFKDGCIIIIDPAANVENGKYVIAEVDGEYIFRQFAQEGEKFFLQPINPGYKSIEIESPSVVRGVITQRAGARRTYHKHYD
ncbi:MAG: S24 family peptidase [Gammaproteobacteria bacterium]|nr:S24 family peptidase [Gammaproteobacteria bacterium]